MEIIQWKQIKKKKGSRHSPLLDSSPWVVGSQLSQILYFIFHYIISFCIVMNFSSNNIITIEGRNLINHKHNYSTSGYFNNNFVNRNFLLRNESLSYRVAIFLAQEEANCLQQYGGRENRTMEYDSFAPFSCVSPSTNVNFDKCEMCRNLTKKFYKNTEECSLFCANKNIFCIHQCQSMIKRNINNFDIIPNSKDHDSNEETDPSPAYFETENYYGLAARETFSNGDNIEFILEEPIVFCEDVISLEKSDNNGNGEGLPYYSSQSITVENNEKHDPLSPFMNYNNNYSTFTTSSSSSGSKRGSHYLYLKWRLKAQNNTNEIADTEIIQNDDAQNLKMMEKLPIPIVFLLEVQTPDDAGWKVIGKRLKNIERLSVPYRTQQYRWRVTAVGPTGIIARTYSRSFVQTLDGFVEPGPPSKIFVAKQIVSDSTVDVVIGWEPSPEKPCAYKINLYPLDAIEHYKTYRLTEPPGVNLHMIKGLKFGSKYDVTMTSRGDNWHFESTLKSQNFTTITCLEAFNFRFDKCEPLPPRNISHQLVSNSNEISTTEEKKGKLVAKLSWLPPLYASEINPISNYSISLGPPLNESTPNHKLFNSAYFRMNRNHNVPGNTTYIYLNDLLQNTRYVVKLTAMSIKGKSQPIQYQLSTKLGEEEILTQNSSNWLYLSISISCMIIGLFGCHFTRVYLRKRKVKKARNQYFQTMEERDNISADWSIVPLNEECYSLKLLGDGPKDKWEISYDQLVMGDIIGQGAFGIVRRATMPKKNLLTLGKQQQSSNNTKRGSDEMETVAVKMLKEKRVSAADDEREELIKEIVTMQNLGCHPQIVSLLGACTKGRILCLILEYCPGGDLLTFLRKVRAKYWPTLGLCDDDDRKTQTFQTQSNSKPPPSINGSTRTSASSNRKSTDSSPINYADIELLSDYSSSPDKIEPGSNLHQDSSKNPTTGPQPSAFPPSEEVDDECRPIDEKDVLSYARQIAMGMEYLEKNKIVHRDLAVRNVLLLGDYKQVKISDFGLSRDVYVWNVYHQKSIAKLPIKWMAIESIFTHVFTSKSDVWSYGILLWELITLGGTPYPGLANPELFKVLKSGYRMERPNNCSEELYALMKKCWRTSSGSRPNFTELRTYVETMMEAAEPSLYLSLMPDLPNDFFNISSRNDFLDTLDETELVRRENFSSISASNSISNFKQYNNKNSKRKSHRNLIGNQCLPSDLKNSSSSTTSTFHQHQNSDGLGNTSNNSNDANEKEKLLNPVDQSQECHSPTNLSIRTNITVIPPSSNSGSDISSSQSHSNQANIHQQYRPSSSKSENKDYFPLCSPANENSNFGVLLAQEPETSDELIHSSSHELNQIEGAHEVKAENVNDENEQYGSNVISQDKHISDVGRESNKRQNSLNFNIKSRAADLGRNCRAASIPHHQPN